MITSLGEEGAGLVLLVHLFVCFVRVSFCYFSLHLGVGGWLRIVIVALPELLYYYFFFFFFSKMPVSTFC